MIKNTILALIFIFVLSLTGCAGTNDWSYKLPNSYEIWRINSEDIIVKNTNTQNNVDEISGFIKEFSYDSRYVFFRTIKNISSNNILEELYYILDTKKNIVYGPFDSVKCLQEQAKELKVNLPTNWHRTSPDPNTST